MRLLLDTHIWIWSLLAPERLTKRIFSEIESSDNEIWLSPISIWELLLLVEKGRVVLDEEPVAWIDRALETMPVQEAPLTKEVAVQSRLVDLPHQDPADRFIAATAVVYDLTLVTADGQILESKRLSVLPNQ